MKNINEIWANSAIEFTKTYKENINKHKAIREVLCLKSIYPHMLLPLKETDVIAGGIGWFLGQELPVDFHPQKDAQIGYAMNIKTIRSLQKKLPEKADKLQEVIDFWLKESTFVKIRETAPEDVKNYLYSNGRAFLDEDGYFRKYPTERVWGSGIISGSYDSRTAGLMPNFDKLVRLGIPGLRKEIAINREKNPDHSGFYDACDIALTTAVEVLESYRAQAEAIISNSDNADVIFRISRCERALVSLKTNPPKDFYEAVSLSAIFVLLCRVADYGRLDVAFGDLLAHDFDNGILTEEQAIEITIAFWKFLRDNGCESASRVLIGGLGRRNPENADRFALVAMEATRRLHDIMPVLTLRNEKNQNPKLLEKAIQCIGEGCIYPTLYNDDAYVPGLAKIMNLPIKDAEQYAPLGCGEILVAGQSSGSPNSTMRFLKALEAALHNGKDGADGFMIGKQTGDIKDFKTFDDLIKAFYAQIKYAFEIDVKLHLWNREVAAKEMSFVFPSLLMDDCLVKGKGLLDGGLRYFGANIEGFGMTNVADSLMVIKKLVFDEKHYTLSELVDILDNDYKYHQEDLELFKSISKYGNNDDEVDSLKCEIEKYVNDLSHEIGIKNNLSWYTVASVNPGGIVIGPYIAASADGRKCGDPMALGNSPMPGCDKSGITSMLLSSAKTSPENGGVVTNMNLSKETITSSPEKFCDLLRVFFKKGGLQLNINCFSKGDLEKALKNPEKYSNLIVRVSGYSARFIDLDPITQKHIMERTLY